MKDIYIYDVKIKNCRSHFEMEMDFPTDCFTIIQGKNGAGKSTIPKAISMALFGDDGAPPGDKISIGDMVNRKTQKDLEIKVFFRIVDSVDGTIDEYRVELYHEHSEKHNQLMLFKNDIPISEKTKSATYKKIEALLYPKDVYHNIIYFSQQVKNFFTSLTNSEQKQIFDSILQTKVYDQFCKNTTLTITTCTSSLDEISKNIEVSDVELGFVISRLAEIEQEKDNFIKEKNDSITSNKLAISQCKTQLELMDKQLKLIDFSKQQLNETNDQLVKLNHIQTTLQQTFDSYLEQLYAKRDNEFMSIEAAIQKQELSDREVIRNKSDEAKKVLMVNNELIHEKIHQIAKKYDTTSISQACSKFESEAYERLNDVTRELNQLHIQFSTDELESDRDKEIKVIDSNIQVLRDKASDLKLKVQDINSEIDQYNNQILIDKESLNAPTPVCSKCLRPFVNLDDIQVIKTGIVELETKIAKLVVQQKQYVKMMDSLKLEFEDATQSKIKLNADCDAAISTIITNRNEKLIELQTQQKSITDDIEAYRLKCDTEIIKLQTDMKNETSKLETEQNQIKSNLDKLSNQVDSDLDAISIKYNQQLINERVIHTEKYKIIQSEYKSKWEIECQENQQQIENLNKLMAELAAKEEQYNIIIHDQQEVKYKLDTLETALSQNELSSFDLTNYDTEMVRKLEIETKIKSHQTKAASLERELEILRFWKIGFSDSGIKSMLIDMAIPHMNSSVATALEQMAPGLFTVSFDTLRETKSGDVRDKFTVNVLHNTKGSDSHKMLSGGEKRIVDLACMEALRSLAEKLHGKRIHNIFYDEVLDSLDDDNRQIFCQYSKVMAVNKNVTLMTHIVADALDPDRIFKL